MMRVCSVLSDVPTAQQSEADVHVTPYSKLHPSTGGTGTNVQDIPSHRITSGRTVSVQLYPTAQQSDAETHVTSNSTLSRLVPSLGEGTIVHELPSHRRINVL
jgi:hypothetical protein